MKHVKVRYCFRPSPNCDRFLFMLNMARNGLMRDIAGLAAFALTAVLTARIGLPQWNLDHTPMMI